MTSISIVNVRRLRSVEQRGQYPCSYVFYDATTGTAYHIRIGTQAERVAKLIASTGIHTYRDYSFIITAESHLGIKYITHMEVI